MFHLAILAPLESSKELPCETSLTYFSTLLSRFEGTLSSNGIQLCITPYFIGSGERPPKDKADAVLISGSPHNVSEKGPIVSTLLSILTHLDEDKCPTIGICFGFQLMVYYFSHKEHVLLGKTTKAPDCVAHVPPFVEFGVGKVHVDPLTETHRTAAPWFSSSIDTHDVPQAHSQFVIHTPQNFLRLRYSQHGESERQFPQQGVFLNNEGGPSTMMGAQYHPELDLNRANGILDDPVKQNLLERDNQRPIILKERAKSLVPKHYRPDFNQFLLCTITKKTTRIEN